MKITSPACVQVVKVVLVQLLSNGDYQYRDTRVITSLLKVHMVLCSAPQSSVISHATPEVYILTHTHRHTRGIHTHTHTQTHQRYTYSHTHRHTRGIHTHTHTDTPEVYILTHTQTHQRYVLSTNN